MTDERPPRPRDPAGVHRRPDPAALLPHRRPFDPPPPEAVQPRQAPLLPPVPGVAPPAQPPADPPRRSRYAGRFTAITAVLAVLAAGALAAGASLLSGGDRAPQGPRWSAWSPTADGVPGAEQIAEHVGRQYRVGRRQLVQVRARALEYRDTQLEVVLRESDAQGGDIRLAEGDGVLFELCGLGPGCAIERGEASTERGLLLSREALELALYAFRYLRGVDQVLVQFPARPGEEPMRMLRFTRDELHPLLARPLSTTLAPRPPKLRDIATAPDTALVGRLATTNVFLYELRDGGLSDRLLLVLDPYSPEEEAQRQQEALEQRLAALRDAAGAATPGG